MVDWTFFPGFGHYQKYFPYQQSIEHNIRTLEFLKKKRIRVGKKSSLEFKNQDGHQEEEGETWVGWGGGYVAVLKIKIPMYTFIS